ncbi:tripartite tricarboxylate transporter substrate binding protein [Bradyrhizobium sp. LHD-71]|uniref:Bug family tripartite tricarboxylate transporter substrate binding protein n=1 Tax=Bradyrhizobium sp. LHD-71 TaxID=3072141 RepID=UPI00280DA070|nr:tripartite tricarboxylate transporter substrate binding protein [Bradyrhizobium sp. LHD-71]MDQ8726542.1 tripartite tricarboxylate transporter substrate binding protein [Bradyrhizobium sp. LHD-71]
MRAVLCWLVALSLLLLQGGLNNSGAQGYPDKPVRVIVPFTPGGSTDHTGRIIAEAMSASLKQPFVVENRPGAAATIGIDLVAKSKPDGYTVGVSGVGATAIVPLLDPKLPYNPARDLEIIAGLSGVDSVFIARPELKQNSIAEVLAFAKDNPEKISYATAGVTGPSHLAMEDLSQLAKVKMLHVPFAGDVPAITGVLTGDVSIGLVAIASATPFLTDRKLKALAAGGPKRLKLLPNLPTVAEQTGFKDYAAYAWNVLVSAKGTPPDAIDKLNEAVNEAVARDDVREKLENLGLKVMPGDAKWAQNFVAAEIAKNKRIIDATGVKRE